MSARATIVWVLLTVWLALPALLEAQEGQEEAYLTKAEFEKWKQDRFELLKKRVDELEPRVGDLVQVAIDQDAKLSAIAKRVSEGDTDTWVPDIRRAWVNPEFRQDMRRAVHGSMRRQGTLEIRNKTAVGHTILVNNSQQVYLGPGETRVVQNVPVGTVSTELLGYERPRNWTLGPPSYEQRIDITPTSPTRVVVARPVPAHPPLRTVYSPVIVDRPVVVDPWVVVDPPIVFGPPVVVEPPAFYFW